MGFKSHPARDRDEDTRKRLRLARLEQALAKAQGTKRDELEAAIRVLRLPPTV